MSDLEKQQAKEKIPRKLKKELVKATAPPKPKKAPPVKKIKRVNAIEDAIEDILVPSKVKTLMEVYMEMRDDNLAFIKQTLEQIYPERWDLKEVAISPSYVENLMHAAPTDVKEGTEEEKKAYLQKLMNGNNLEITSAERTMVRRVMAYDILIHFPELKVTDGSTRHTMKDMWISLQLSPLFNSSREGTGGTYFYGMRSSMTYAEISSNYTFSHLHGGWQRSVGGQWDYFCLGHTDFAFLCTDIQRNFRKEYFELWCLQLIDYLSWESLTGGPYRHIQHVREQNMSGVSSTSQNVSGTDLSRVLTSMLQLEDTIPTKLLKAPSYYVIVTDENEEFAEMVTKHATLVTPHLLWNYNEVTKVSQPPGGVTNKSQTIASIKRDYVKRGDLFTFRGKGVPFVIIDDNSPQEDNSPKRANPTLIQYVANQFDQTFLTTILNEHRK